MNTTFYRCCFCNNLIKSSNGDPCEIDILILINIDKPNKKFFTNNLVESR